MKITQGSSSIAPGKQTTTARNDALQEVSLKTTGPKIGSPESLWMFALNCNLSAKAAHTTSSIATTSSAPPQSPHDAFPIPHTITPTIASDSSKLKVPSKHGYPVARAVAKSSQHHNLSKRQKKSLLVIPPKKENWSSRTDIASLHNDTISDNDDGDDGIDID